MTHTTDQRGATEWAYDPDLFGHYIVEPIIGYDPAQKQVYKQICEITRTENYMENVRLILAAKKMLAALERIATDFRGISNPTNALREIAREAIAAQVAK